MRQFDCVFLPQKETKVSFLRTVGVGWGGGGGGGGGGETRPLEKVLEVRHRGAAQPSVRSNKASVHILQTCIHAVHTKKVPRKTKVHGDVLSNGLISTCLQKSADLLPPPPTDNQRHA